MTPATTPLRDRNYSAVFQRHITGEWKRKKAPNGLKKAWTGAQSLPKDTTERIFCDAGFQAWVSYRLATNVGGTHYSGKMDDMETIAALHQLPISSRQNIASELANTAPHPTFDAAVKKIQPPPTQTEERTSSSTSMAGLPPEGEGQTGPRTGPDPGSAPGAAPFLATGNMDLYSEQRTAPIDAAEKQHLGNATGIEDVFPSYLCGALRKTEMGASVTMTFPYDQGAIHCLMSLAILPNKLEHIAMKLFGLHLETDGNMRYAIIGNSRMIPTTENSVQGASRVALLELLGEITDTAVARCPLREFELKTQSMQYTSCASLNWSGDARQDGILSLNLGFREGVAIKEKLYPPWNTNNGVSLV